MNLNNISLPYPVLGISDDILPLLPEAPISFELSSDNYNYTFDIELHYENKDIQQLIDEGKAEFHVNTNVLAPCCVIVSLQASQCLRY